MMVSPVKKSIRSLLREKVSQQAHKAVKPKVWNQIWDAVAEDIWQQMLFAEDIEQAWG
jgi:hypothetical protein